MKENPGKNPQRRGKPAGGRYITVILKNSENVYTGTPSLSEDDKNIVYRRNVQTRSRKTPIPGARVSREYL